MAKLVPWSKSPLEEGDIPVAIISLSDAKSRRTALIDRGVAPELVDGFWPACDMRGLPDAELQAYSQYDDIKKMYGRPPISAELGCYFSHSEIVKWLSRQDSVSQVVVFEDDVIPNGFDSFSQLSDLAESFSDIASTDQPIICHLGPRLEQWKLAFVRRISRSCANADGVELFDFVDKKVGLWRAHAYLINRAAAIKYSSVVGETGFLADDWRFLTKSTSSRMLLVNPPLFIQDEEAESTIDPEDKRVLVKSSLVSSNKSLWLSCENFSSFLGKISKKLKRIVKACLVRFYRGLPAKQL